MKKSVALWFERAQYDLESARLMMENGRYLYVVFMCQQAVEKLLKGIIQEKTDALPPYTHNLTLLAKYIDLSLSEEQFDFLALLNRYYLNTRYPDHKQKLADNIDQKKTHQILKSSEELYQCLLKELTM